jgi:hypothetical protein
MEEQPRTVTNHTSDGSKVHLQTLLRNLATIVKTKSNRHKPIAAFDLLTHPTAIHQRTFDLVGVPLRLPELNPNCTQ